MFLIFINDLPQLFNNPTNILLYADDAKLYRPINCFADSELLQRNLASFWACCKSNYLPLNISKCQVISFARSKTPIIYNCNIKNNILIRVNTIKDLGIHFDYDLTFKTNHKLLLNKSYI